MYKYNKKQDEITDTSEKGKTGIPSVMKKSFEQSSGFSFDDVRVHYSSEKPAQLHAHAYTAGNDVLLLRDRKNICLMSWDMWFSRKAIW